MTVKVIALIVGIVIALIVLRFLIVTPLAFVMGFGVETSSPLSPLRV